MANISHFTQTVNGVSTTYDIHDANAVDLTSNQTVGGIKTFSNAPVVNSISLDGKTIDTDANGNMTYDSHIVDTIEEQGNGYIRYSNGLQICWGTSTYSGFPFPKPFVAAPAINLTHQTFYNRKVLTNVGAMDGSNCFYNSYDVEDQTFIDTSVLFIAIGYWK